MSDIIASSSLYLPPDIYLGPSPPPPADYGDPAPAGPAAKAKPAPAVRGGAAPGLHRFFKGVQDYYKGNESPACLALKAYIDDAKVAYKSAGGNTQIDADGGILVPPETSYDIWMRSTYSPELDLLSRLSRRLVPSGRYQRVAVSERTRAAGGRNGGVRSYLTGEGDPISARSRPLFRGMEQVLWKLRTDIALTGELYEDDPAVTEQLDAIVASELRYTLTGFAINGLGSGQPLGMLRAGSKITVAAEAGQAAGSLVAENLIKMWGRLWPASRPGAVWLGTMDAEEALLGMKLSGSSREARLLNYTPPGPNNVFPLICGRPLLTLEQLPALGTEGDLILCEPGSIQLVSRTLAPVFAASSHVLFDRNEEVFRWTWRVDIQSLWDVPVTPANGSATRSNIVTCATR